MLESKFFLPLFVLRMECALEAHHQANKQTKSEFNQTLQELHHESLTKCTSILQLTPQAYGC